METTDTEVQNADTENYYEGCWFRFTGGKLVQADIPEWAVGNMGISHQQMEKAGYSVCHHDFESSRNPYGLLTINRYGKGNPPHWVVLFYEGNFTEYVVEIDNFPDWLEFCRYIAPILTADVMMYLEYLAKHTLDKVLPDKRRC